MGLAIVCLVSDGWLCAGRCPCGGNGRAPISHGAISSGDGDGNGRYIAYTSYDPVTEIRQLMVLDTETGAAEVRAERGEFPAWSKDGNMIFYLELDTNSNVARIMAVGREKGSPMFIAESRFPNCPGVCLPHTAFDYSP